MKEDIALLYFDETGEKGYLKKEPAPESFGVVGGFIFPVDMLDFMKSNLGSLFNGISGTHEKRHASEVFKDGSNQGVRNQFFEFLLKTERITIIYEALYSLGHFRYVQMLEENKQKAISENQNKTVKFSNNPYKESMYSVLMEGFLVKLEEICADSGYSEIKITSDSIDSTIYQHFSTLQNQINSNTQTDTIKAFDINLQRELEGTIKTNIGNFNMSSGLIATFIEPGNSDLTFAADIIVNSIQHHLKEKIENKPRINSDQVMKDFKLYPQIAGLDDDYFMDNFYGVE